MRGNVVAYRESVGKMAFPFVKNEQENNWILKVWLLGEETEKTEVKLIVFGIILVNLQDNMAKKENGFKDGCWKYKLLWLNYGKT